MSIKVVATNRKARHDYFLLETHEAGIVLKGSEIKSVRGGQISLAQAYITIEDHEAWLLNAYIAPYDEASHFNHDPVRPRKLLLHDSEIRRLGNNIRKKGATIVPLRVYLKGGLAKVEIAVAKGKKQYDKRADIAKRDVEQELDRRQKNRG